MGGHGHAKVPEVPDWRTYKVADAKQLVYVEKILASQGLKDNWLRNEVFMYTEFENKFPAASRFKNVLFTGFKKGLVAAIITTIIEKTFFNPHGDKHDHH